MILQSIKWSDKACNEQEMYYRSDSKAKIVDEEILILRNGKFSTNTYINMFDYTFWKKYTVVEQISLRIEYEGRGKLLLYSLFKTSRKLISIYELDKKQIGEEYFIFQDDVNISNLYFEIITEGEIYIKNASYVCDQIGNYTHLSLIICTYRRKNDIERNIEQILGSLFFDEKSTYYGKLDVCIVDNGSELQEVDKKYFKIVHNPNTGGSGGFTRGILETRKVEEHYGTTQVVFMDDDVLFMNESLYRLYALLSLLKVEYLESVVSGRMFRLDQRHIQYTASEIWNKGQIIHIDGNQDMRDENNLYNMNHASGEYTGWWFGCFPMGFVRENLPLPFFLHCDDVEYGLRHGGTPIVLNGIQVWHETYEYRISPTITYYDVRNSMIVNTIYKFMDHEELFQYWYKQVGNPRYDLRFAVIEAMKDYLKGKEFFTYQGKRKKRIFTMNNKMLRYLLSIYWRIVVIMWKIKGEKTYSLYRNSNDI